MSEPSKPRKVRWLDLDKPIEYRGRAHPEWRGKRCRVLAVAPQCKGTPRNVAVEFLDMPPYGGVEAIVPLGTLRNVKEVTP